MDVNCEGCAGCCLDWRPLADGVLNHERQGPREPLDDTYNLALLRRDEVRAFVEAGLADALVPRLWTAGDDGVTVDGIDLASIAGRPAFGVGLRKVPKPVAPFDHEPSWLSTCVFLDPSTLQCRIHDDELYPETCRTYPGTNLLLDVETECERVEREYSGWRLLDDDPPADTEPLFDPGALGTAVFAHPDPGRIADAVERLSEGESTRKDRAEFVAIAAAASPGTVAIADEYYERTLERALDAGSWVGAAIEKWESLERNGEADPSLATSVEGERGAPPTPGWESVGSDHRD
ncbi:YkgJ family cysteine cluster protein [Halorhabdus amylolytica]|uniref:YkgJ family cysteine cluster protein n=1 Tax=Halorhabdus amylolytica TaxID=2559573 RepID=UPI0010AA7E1C|nr:YkgJ family cysteine cluster protein [Halorhabdus amylolytica]